MDQEGQELRPPICDVFPERFANFSKLSEYQKVAHDMYIAGSRSSR